MNKHVQIKSILYLTYLDAVGEVPAAALRERVRECVREKHKRGGKAHKANDIYMQRWE